MTSFNQQCYDLISKIPKGKVTTYKEVAAALNTKAYRAVGNAMNKNPNLVKVPCHRVVGSSGSLTGYARGLNRKKTLLKEEGVQFKGEKVDLDKSMYRF